MDGCEEIKEIKTHERPIREAAPAVTTNYMSSGSIAGAAPGVGNTEVPRKQLGLAELRAIIQAEIHEIDETLNSLDHHNENYIAELTSKRAALQTYLKQN